MTIKYSIWEENKTISCFTLFIWPSDLTYTLVKNRRRQLKYTTSVELLSIRSFRSSYGTNSCCERCYWKADTAVTLLDYLSCEDCTILDGNGQKRTVQMVIDEVSEPDAQTAINDIILTK